VLAQDDPAASSLDTLEPTARGIEVYTLFDTTITNDFDDVQSALTDFNNDVNDADSQYRPGVPGEDPNNSNSYATDAMQAVTGLDIANTSPLTLPGFGEPLENVELPVPVVDRSELK
jgi:hypothetical protein